MKLLSKEFLYSLFISLLVIVGQMTIQSFGAEMHDPRMGTLTGAGGHGAEGSVNLNGHNLILSNIHVDKVPDGRVYLANDAGYESAVELGLLTQFSGTLEFDIPDNVNPDDYNSVLIWCKKFSVEIGHADLKKSTK